MNQPRRQCEKIGIVLALLMSAGALGLEIQQRRGQAPGTGLAPSPAVTAPATVDGSGKLAPLPVGPGGKEITAKDGKTIRMQGFMNGRKQYELSAQRLILSQGERSTAGEVIGGTLIGKDGKATVRFTAERATMDTQTKDLQVEGQVQVQSLDPNNPVMFETRGMRWQAAAEKLLCDNPVQVSQPGVDLRASRMTADVRLKKLSLEGGIALEADADKVKKSLELMKNTAKGAR